MFSHNGASGSESKQRYVSSSSPGCAIGANLLSTIEDLFYVYITVTHRLLQIHLNLT